MKPPGQTYIDLVLIGGGHAQISVLKSFAMSPVAGVRLTLITDVLHAPYSGMLPGFAEGLYNFDDMHINLLALARFAGARLIKNSVTDIDFLNNYIFLSDKTKLYYDVLSVNSGASPQRGQIKGGAEHGIFVKPIAHFLEQLPAEQDISGPVAIIGGGAAGCELALALNQRYSHLSEPPPFHLFSRNGRVLPAAPPLASYVMEKALTEAGITLHKGQPVTRITASHVVTQDGHRTPARHAFIVTAASAAPWIQSLALSHDGQGFIAVRPTLQSIEYDNVFAAGDVASLSHAPREKAGVFAVRAGPVLSANLRAYITGQPLKHWHPQRHYLALIGLGRKRALAMRGPFVMKAGFFWTLKEWIDRRFVQKFNELPKMKTDAQAVPALAKRLSPELGAEPEDGIYCAACGAKSDADTLARAITDACIIAAEQGADPQYLPHGDISTDAALFTASADTGSADTGSADTGSFCQSVDFISQHISDPYQFGRIAALHALSDLFVAGSQPLCASAIVTLARARTPMSASDLTLMLAGAIFELARHKATLIGGHTTVGLEPVLGFAVTGQQVNLRQPVKTNSRKTREAGTFALILTKPLGVGLVLAAEMRAQCPPASYEQALAVMLQSNADAAEILFSLSADIIMTDVTGFGLARHSLNLAKRAGQAGVCIDTSRLAVIDGVYELASAGITSSLNRHNQTAVQDSRTANSRAGFLPDLSVIEAVLFDPQTSGGILAAVRVQDAHRACQLLHAAGYDRADVIGHLSAEQPGLTLKQLQSKLD